jgi:hypothetical protein
MPLARDWDLKLKKNPGFRKYRPMELKKQRTKELPSKKIFAEIPINQGFYRQQGSQRMAPRPLCFPDECYLYFSGKSLISKY